MVYAVAVAAGPASRLCPAGWHFWDRIFGEAASSVFDSRFAHALDKDLSAKTVEHHQKQTIWVSGRCTRPFGPWPRSGGRCYRT